jgi:GT2 family glycosyltransferase
MKNRSGIDLSIIILNFNTVTLLDDCLSSIINSDFGKFSYEILVSDNGSTDGSQAMIKQKFPQVMLFDNKENLGFAKGNNVAIKNATGRYVLLLNSDTIVERLTFKIMLDFMEKNPKIGLSTCRLRLMDGTIDPACHRGFPTPWAALCYFSKLDRLFPRIPFFSGYHQLYKDFNTPHEIDCPSGAFFLLRKETLNQVGFLDEDYFFYAEDIDLAYRIKQAGWQVWYNPSTQILHKKKQSGRSHADRARRVKTEIYFHTYNRLFYRKHYAQVYGPVLNWAVNAVYDVRLFFLHKFAI